MPKSKVRKKAAKKKLNKRQQDVVDRRVAKMRLAEMEEMLTFLEYAEANHMQKLTEGEPVTLVVEDVKDEPVQMLYRHEPEEVKDGGS